jgi:O-methyltransferase
MLWASGLNLKHANVNDALFVECGTGRGYMAAGICNYHRFNENSPPFYLVDSFTPYLVSSDGKQPSKVAPADFAYTGDVDDVRNYFSQYSKVKIVQGIIPEALAKLPNQSILFLHLDLNSADAEQAALQYLAERFITGTVILFDDYGGPGGEKQALIHEEFAKFHGKEFLSLPTGQALIIW